jgi:segregation and condensation protein A
MTRLLVTLPEGARLKALLPEIAEVGANRTLHVRAAVAATLVAGLELARFGALTLEQDVPWHSILARHQAGGSRGAAPEPAEQGRQRPS